MKIGFLSHLDLNLYLFRLPIMRELLKKGYEVYAIAPSGIYLDMMAKEGIKTIPYSISRSSLNPLNELKAIYNIYRAIKPLKLEIIHTFTAKPNIYGTIASKMAKVPHIYNLVEGLGSFYLEDNFKSVIVRNIIEKLYKVVFLLSDRVVFVNSSDPAYLVEKKVIKNTKVKIIKSVGVDSKKFTCTKKVKNKKLKVLMVARLIKHKGVLEFIEASKECKEFEFIFAGAEDEGNPSGLKKDIFDQTLIKYLGHVDDVKSLVCECDIFVLPSYKEGLPVTLLEASSCSKPLLATDVSGCRDVVEDGVNGFLVELKNSKALADAIKKLSDQNLRERFGKNAREKVLKEFDIDIVVKKYMEFYGV